MKQKRGQFYLVAAIIIIAVIITIFTVSNYISKKETIKLFDLGEELSIESQNVLDYGVYSTLSDEDMDILLVRLIENYVDDPGNLYVIFGDRQGMTVMAYQELTEAEDVYVSTGGTSHPLLISISDETGEGLYTTSPSETNIDKIVITIGDHEYEFALGNGENFYFVISQEIGGERYVATGRKHYRH